MSRHTTSILQIPGRREFLTALRLNSENLSIKVGIINIIIYPYLCIPLPFLLFSNTHDIFFTFLREIDRSTHTSCITFFFISIKNWNNSYFLLNHTDYTPFSDVLGATDRSLVEGVDMGMDRGLQEPYLKIPPTSLSSSYSHTNNAINGMPLIISIVYKLIPFISLTFYLFSN